VINDKVNNKVVDSVHFDVEQIFGYLVTHFGLAEKAKRGVVQFAITCDGARLDDLIGHLIMCVQLAGRIYSMILEICKQISGVFQFL
jgi:hypothetical protein